MILFASTVHVIGKAQCPLYTVQTAEQVLWLPAYEGPRHSPLTLISVLIMVFLGLHKFFKTSFHPIILIILLEHIHQPEAQKIKGYSSKAQR